MGNPSHNDQQRHKGQKREQILKDAKRFKHLSFDKFRELAKAQDLSPFQKIGFPDAYREGHEARILEDIRQKLPALNRASSTIIDLGCGCSELPQMLIEAADEQQQHLVMVDSQEMLELLPKGNYQSLAGYFPEMPALREQYAGKADAVLVYSVMHYVLEEGNLFGFIDAAVELLAPGGGLLLADLPNINMRRRFFTSETGVASHKAFMNTDDPPEVDHLKAAPLVFDDGIVFGILQRYRNFGYQTYVMPQDPALPMANRREDILIVRY